MKKSYYLITLPANKDKSRVNDFLSKGVPSRLPSESLFVRWNLDKTQAIVLGYMPDILSEFAKGKSFIEYLGECIGGYAEKKVRDFVSDHEKEWNAQNN